MQVVHGSQPKYRFANRCVLYFKPYFSVMEILLLSECLLMLNFGCSTLKFSQILIG